MPDTMDEVKEDIALRSRILRYKGEAEVNAGVVLMRLNKAIKQLTASTIDGSARAYGYLINITDFLGQSMNCVVYDLRSKNQVYVGYPEDNSNGIIQLVNARFDDITAPPKFVSDPVAEKLFNDCLNFNIKTKISNYRLGTLVPTQCGALFEFNFEQLSDYLIIPSLASQISVIFQCTTKIRKTYKGVKWGNPNRIKSILENTFSNIGIEVLELPEGLEFIESNGFFGNKIREVYFPSSIQILEQWCFNYNPLEKVVFKPLSERDTVLNIGRFSQSGCDTLQELILPPTGAYRLGELNLGVKPQLKLLDLGRDCTSISHKAFTAKAGTTLLSGTTIKCPDRLREELTKALNMCHTQDITIIYT